MQIPFTTTFSKIPSTYIKTNQSIDIIDNFNYDDPSESVYKITGVRGSGKTVLLAKIEEIGTQEKLNSAFLLNCSVGKIVNLRNGPSLNFNLSVNNILNNRNVMATGYQQGRFDYTNYDMERYPNKYMYSQGIRLFLNMGIRF